MVRLFTIGTALLAGAIVLAASGNGAVAATTDVQVEDFAFSPPAINITAGDTVDWTFAGSFEHNVTAVDGSFASATMASGSFQRSFSQAGTFAYYCTIHGDAQGNGMAGTVVVAGAPLTDTPQASSTPQPTGTREPTATAVIASPVPANATPVASAPTSASAASPTASPNASAAEAVGAPNAGAGPGARSTPWRWIALLLATAGATCIGGALAMAKRRVR